MFAELKRRIEERVPKAVEKRMAEDELTLYRLGVGELCLFYDEATVRFSPFELLALDDGELQGIKNALLASVQQASRKTGLSLSPSTLRFIDPQGDAHVIAHELDHAREMPDHCVVDVTFAGSLGLLEVYGYCVAPLTAGIDEKTLARSCIAPAALSSTDRKNAVHYAKRYAERSGDWAFVREVEEVIVRKPRITSDGTVIYADQIIRPEDHSSLPTPD